MEVEREKVQTLSQDIPQWVKGAFLKGSEKEQDHTRADYSRRYTKTENERARFRTIIRNGKS